MNDLISRQAAIAVADYSDYVGLSVDDVKKVTDEVVKGLRRLPSAQQWIPCNERLPSGQENVIVTIYDDHGDTPWEYTTNAWHIDGVWIADNDIVCGSVIAWMPLPQPWEGVKDEHIN